MACTRGRVRTPGGCSSCAGLRNGHTWKLTLLYPERRSDWRGAAVSSRAQPLQVRCTDSIAIGFGQYQIGPVQARGITHRGKPKASSGSQAQFRISCICAEIQGALHRQMLSMHVEEP